jgi:putative copper resistance protein D
MSLFVDLFGYLSVILQGFDMVAQAALIGSALFFLLQADVLSGSSSASPAFLRFAAKVVMIAAAAEIAIVLLNAALNVAVLVESLSLPLADALGADFVYAATIKATAALAMLALVTAWPKRCFENRFLLASLSVVVLMAAVADSHAMARLDNRLAMALVTGVHELGAALWLGGLPLFLGMLKTTSDATVKLAASRRYSTISMSGVGLILVSALAIYFAYIGEPAALYGTSYGAMAMAKAAMLGILLLLGYRNFRVIRAASAGNSDLRPVERFVTVEIGIGLAVLFAAASITTQPPAVDQVNERASFSEIVERNWPRMPRFESPDHASLAIPALQAKLDNEWRQDQAQSRPQAFIPGAGVPPPRNAEDIAWSEYNHNWAGLLVLLIGIVALIEHTGRARWARNWPLLFILLAAFVFIRSDPEVWPSGSIGFFESLRDPEVFQHKLLALLVVAFALFEWGVRVGRLKWPPAQLVFPMLTAVGGMLLLTHSHAISSVKQQLLIEWSHLPMGVLGVVGGWARWLEIKAPESDGKWAGWLWPSCFVLIGLLLLNYREA